MMVSYEEHDRLGAALDIKVFTHREASTRRQMSGGRKEENKQRKDKGRICNGKKRRNKPKMEGKTNNTELRKNICTDIVRRQEERKCKCGAGNEDGTTCATKRSRT